MFLTQAAFAQVSGVMRWIAEAVAGLSAPVLDELQIFVSTTDQSRINQQMLRYFANARADIERTRG